MIDTDKYENITPERWTVDEEDPCRVVDAQDCTIARTDFVSIDEEREWQLANAQLIADAPLLLAEVKRLREGYKKIARDYDFNAIISQGRHRIRPSLDVDTKHGVKVTYHQKACLRMMELFEND